MRPGLCQCVEERPDEATTVARALVVGQQVDMEVGGIAGQLVQQHPLGVVEQDHELFLRADRRPDRFPVTPGQRGEPLTSVPAHEPGRVRRPQYITDRSAFVVEHERQPGLEVQVRTGEDVRQQVVVGVLPGGVPAGIAGPDAYLVDRITVVAPVPGG